MPEAIEQFRGLPLPLVQERSLEVGGRTIAWVERGNLHGAPVLFLHGTPGVWSDYKLVLADEALNETYRLLSVDRPGWGASSGEIVPDLAEQAALILPVLESAVARQGQRAVVVGHSLGGPVAAWLACARPDLVSGLVLLGPAMLPPAEPGSDTVRWYNTLADLPPFHWLLGQFAGPLAKANDEIMGFGAGLTRLKPLLAQATVPTVVVQGEEDDLVAPENARYVERTMVTAPVRVHWLKDFGHLIPFQRPEAIARAVEVVRE